MRGQNLSPATATGYSKSSVNASPSEAFGAEHLGPFDQRQSNWVRLTHQALLGSLPGWLLSGVPGRKRKWLSRKAAIRVSCEWCELNPQASAVCEAETFVKVSTLFRRPVATPEVINTEIVNRK
jgi:hypothetical protein